MDDTRVAEFMREESRESRDRTELHQSRRCGEQRVAGNGLDVERGRRKEDRHCTSTSGQKVELFIVSIFDTNFFISF